MLHGSSRNYFILICNNNLFLSTAVTWRDQDARLTVHFENGFTLTDARGNEGNGRAQVLWYFPFEKLKRSADDGQRRLWLEFGADESDQVSSVWKQTFIRLVSFGLSYLDSRVHTSKIYTIVIVNFRLFLFLSCTMYLVI